MRRAERDKQTPISSGTPASTDEREKSDEEKIAEEKSDNEKSDDALSDE